MHPTFRRRWAAGALSLLLVLPAQPQPALSEAQAKAGLVLNFARYVEWPAQAFASREAPVVACVWGRDAVAAALSALESRPVQGRTLRVRRAAVLEELRGCHVVFVGETDERRAVPVLRALAALPVLTVGDSERFIDIGGAIGIVHGDERLQFEINRQALDQAQIRASANLLRLARNAP
jgi:hypothetical protein